MPTKRDRRPYATVRRALACAVLIVAMLEAEGSAMAVDGPDMVGQTQEPTEPPEDGPPADGTEEPAPEPGDVPAAEWVGAILFLVAAAGLAVWQTGKKSSSTDTDE